MQRVVNIAKNLKEAEEWDILQQINMTSSERRKVAKELRIRFFGKNTKDVREVYKKND